MFWKHKIFSLLLFMLAGFGSALAQTTQQQPDGKMNTVFWVVIVIFLGITVTMVVLERRLNRIERQVKQKETLKDT